MKISPKQNSLVRTMASLTGNQRACLYTEPLWGIPYNLYLPFVSVYMAALGMSPTMIGLVSTLFLASQIFWALLSGVITDKLGRRLTTLIFDTFCWSIPALLWMFAQDYRWFLVAALFNGAWRVTETAWGLLMIEDAKQEQMVHLYSIMHVAGLVAGFFAPLAYFFVKKYSVIPAMRVLYGLTFVMMTAKFVILYFTTKETSVGVRRKAETRDVSLPSRLWDSRKLLLRMLKTRRTMLTVALIACFAGVKNVSDTFWPLLVTEKLGIAAENLSLFSTVKTLLMLGCYFLIVPLLDLRRFRNPVLLGLMLFIAQQVLMLVMPQGAYALVVLTVVMEALALSMLNPLTASLQMVNIDREERARMLGFFYALCMLITSPLGTIAGIMAESDRSLPFALNLLLTVAALILTLKLWRIGLPRADTEEKG
jgi:MFS family permease